jgi:Tfp pilus assembly ATPase PilU
LKVKEAEERELLIKAELEDLKELVKQQQEEYLVTLDQEIKKICMIEDEDSG